MAPIAEANSGDCSGVVAQSWPVRPTGGPPKMNEQVWTDAEEAEEAYCDGLERLIEVLEALPGAKLVGKKADSEIYVHDLIGATRLHNPGLMAFRRSRLQVDAFLAKTHPRSGFVAMDRINGRFFPW